MSRWQKQIAHGKLYVSRWQFYTTSTTEIKIQWSEDANLYYLQHSSQ